MSVTSANVPGHPARPREFRPSSQSASATVGARTGVLGPVHGSDAELARAVRHAALLRRGFYLVVLLVALAGQVSGAVESLHLPPLWAVPAVAALELGGMVVLANADLRRRLGERATGSRLLSAAIAAGAVWFNWTAHHNPLAGGFFAGMSALGYLVWLTHSENSRRDRLRARGELPPTTPGYELAGHWLRHPWLTHHARTLAKTDPALGLYGSIQAAAEERERRRRRTAIATVLHRKIRATVDRDTAAIAVAVYDLDRIAQHLADSADTRGLAEIIAADLHPHRIAVPAGHGAGPPTGSLPSSIRSDAVGSVPSTPANAVARAHVTTAGASQDLVGRQPGPRRGPAGYQPAAEGGAVAAASSADDADETGGDTQQVPSDTAAAVDFWVQRDPGLHPAIIAERIGRSERTVRRHLASSLSRVAATAEPTRL